MKKNALLLAISLVAVMTADAQPLERSVEESRHAREKTYFYAKIFSGPNFLQDTTLEGNHAQYQTGYIIAGSLGYRSHYGLRLEAAYAFRRNNLEEIQFVQQGSSKEGHSQTSSYMANLLWDLPLRSSGCGFWGTQPFIGAGVGYDCQQTHASNSRVVFDQKWQHFSWQLMAGLAYPVLRNTDITLEYTFHQGGSAFCNHAVGIGLEYRCPL